MNKKRKLNPEDENIYHMCPLEVFFIILKHMKASYTRELERLRMKEQEYNNLIEAIEKLVDVRHIDIDVIHDASLCDIIKPKSELCLDCNSTCEQCEEPTYEPVIRTIIGDICLPCAEKLQEQIKKGFGPKIKN